MSEPLSALEIGIRATVTSCIQYGLTMDTVDTLIKREFLSQALEAAGNNQSQTALNIGVWTGRNDVLVWGDKSGLNGSIQKDCMDAGFINAAKVIDRLPSNLGVKL